MARMQKSVHRAIISARTGKHLPRVNCSLPCARVVVRIGAWLCRGGHAREGSRYFLSSRRYSVPGIVTSAAVGRWTRGFPQRWSGKGLMSSQVDEGLVAVRERRWEEMRRDDRNSEGEGRGRQAYLRFPFTTSGHIECVFSQDTYHFLYKVIWSTWRLAAHLRRGFSVTADSVKISKTVSLSRNYDFESNLNIWDYNYNFHKNLWKV